jgi:hypothetical protein
MSKIIRDTLFNHFKTVLLKTEGYMFGVDGLAEILDPLLAIEHRDAWLKAAFGKKMVKPTSPALINDNLPANEQNKDPWPTGEEPWKNGAG